MPRTFVMVSGLPGSGNRLLKRLFHAAGADSCVRHGSGGEKMLRKVLDAHPDHRQLCVIPVRDFHSEATSNRWTHRRGQRTEAVDCVMRVLAERRVPTRMVSYESLWLYPDESKNALLEWAGLPAVPWPEGDRPRDENSKWKTPEHLGDLRTRCATEAERAVIVPGNDGNPTTQVALAVGVVT